MSEERPVPPYVGWAVLELLGHRTVAGYVLHEPVCGVEMLRVEIPSVGDLPGYRQFYHPQAVYCITPSHEDECRALASVLEPLRDLRWKVEHVRRRDSAAHPDSPRPHPIIEGDDEESDDITI